MDMCRLLRKYKLLSVYVEHTVYAQEAIEQLDGPEATEAEDIGSTGRVRQETGEKSDDDIDENA